MSKTRRATTRKGTTISRKGTTIRRTQSISYGTTTNKKWIQNALKHLHKGILHEELGLKPKQKIPTKLLVKATHSKNPTIRRQAILAETLNRFHNHH